MPIECVCVYCYVNFEDRNFADVITFIIILILIIKFYINSHVNIHKNENMIG